MIDQAILKEANERLKARFTAAGGFDGETDSTNPALTSGLDVIEQAVTDEAVRMVVARSGLKPDEIDRLDDEAYEAMIDVAEMIGSGIILGIQAARMDNES